MKSFDLVAHLKRQRAFSRATFGPGVRVNGTIDHIKKELAEIEASHGVDVIEWIDIVLLALDGAWRAAQALSMPIEVVAGAIESKQAKNELRDWPDWRTSDRNKAIEHTREVPAATPACCPYTACPSPYLCKGGCKSGTAEAIS
jgi:hypothetical protein